MTILSRAARAARGGQPLDDVAGPAAERAPITLTTTQRHDLIDLWSTLLRDVYPHYLQKVAFYGFDPLPALQALRRDIPYLDSAGFLRELRRLINRLRDQHTQMFVVDPAVRDGSYVASLPFLVEGYGSYLSPTYLVTKTTGDLTDPAFTIGVRLNSWNGVPFARAVDLYADSLTGGRPDARRARALETLTQRPLTYLPPPEEQWVELGYRRPDDPAESPDRTIRFQWRAIQPGTATSADILLETRTRRAINVTSETARRARKLLFATALWEADQRIVQPQAKQAGWIETTFPDAISARHVDTPHGTFGYLRIWTFDVDHTHRFIDDLAIILRAMPPAGLIIDLRSNPGGVIDVAERMLQLFTDHPVESAGFACRATLAMMEITSAEGNGADLADWAGSTQAAIELGEEFSRHLPITDPDSLPGIERAYHGPVIAIVDANTYSCGDLFAAGIVDHRIGEIVSVGAATGAGGANVWTDNEIQYAYHAAHRTLPPLPPGIGFTISVRRMVRSGDNAGLAIEDIGVPGDDTYEMTQRDLEDSNHDLIEYCARLLKSA